MKKLGEVTQGLEGDALAAVVKALGKQGYGEKVQLVINDETNMIEFYRTERESDLVMRAPYFREGAQAWVRDWFCTSPQMFGCAFELAQFVAGGDRRPFAGPRPEEEIAACEALLLACPLDQVGDVEPRLELQVFTAKSWQPHKERLLAALHTDPAEGVPVVARERTCTGCGVVFMPPSDRPETEFCSGCMEEVECQQCGQPFEAASDEEVDVGICPQCLAEGAEEAEDLAEGDEVAAAEDETAEQPAEDADAGAEADEAPPTEQRCRACGGSFTPPAERPEAEFCAACFAGGGPPLDEVEDGTTEQAGTADKDLTISRSCVACGEAFVRPLHLSGGDTEGIYCAACRTPEKQQERQRKLKLKGKGKAA